MYRDRNFAARALLIAASVCVSCGGSESDGMTIGFARQELLENTASVAIYFYEGTTTCADIRATRPRPPSILGPYRADLDDEGRARGITFSRTDIPAGVYLVFVDALDASQTVIGTGCAPSQTVYDREISRIRVTVS